MKNGAKDELPSTGDYRYEGLYQKPLKPGERACGKSACVWHANLLLLSLIDPGVTQKTRKGDTAHRSWSSSQAGKSRDLESKEGVAGLDE